MYDHRRSARRRLRAGSVLALSVLAAGAGCAGHGGETTYRDGKGPLGGVKVGGASSAHGPGLFDGRRSVTFGSSVLCLKDPDKKVVLQSVEVVDGSARPLKTEVWLRTATRRQLNAVHGKAKGDYLGSYAADGAPPKIDITPPGRATRYMPGTFTRHVKGFRVTDSCEDATKTNISMSKDTTSPSGIVELMIVLTVDQRGGSSPRQYINILEDGKPRRVEQSWEIVACGTDLVTTEMCKRAPWAKKVRSS